MGWGLGHPGHWIGHIVGYHTPLYILKWDLDNYPFPDNQVYLETGYLPSSPRNGTWIPYPHPPEHGTWIPYPHPLGTWYLDTLPSSPSEHGTSIPYPHPPEHGTWIPYPHPLEHGTWIPYPHPLGHGTWIPYPHPLGHGTWMQYPATTDILWSSLQTCSNFFTLEPTSTLPFPRNTQVLTDLGNTHG